MDQTKKAFKTPCHTCRQWTCECPKTEVAAPRVELDIPRLVKQLVDSCLQGRDYVSSAELSAALGSIEFPKSVDESQVKVWIGDCLLEKNFVSALKVCEVIDAKIIELDLHPDAQEVIAIVQNFLNGIDFVSTIQVKNCVQEALQNFSVEPDRDAIKSIVVDCFKQVLQELSKDGFSFVEGGDLECLENGQVTLTLRQSGGQADVIVGADFSKFLPQNQDLPSYSACFSHDPQRTFPFSAQGKVQLNFPTLKAGQFQGGFLMATYDQAANCFLLPYGGPSEEFIEGLVDESALATRALLDQCLTSFDAFVDDGSVVLSIAQKNCPAQQATFDLPMVDQSGDVVNQVTAAQLTCDDNGQVGLRINQLIGSAVEATADFSKFFDALEPSDPLTFCFDYGGLDFTAQADKVTLSLNLKVNSYSQGPLAANADLTGQCLVLPYNGPSTAELNALAKSQAQVCVDQAIAALPPQDSYCVGALTSTFSEGVLRTTLEQENCPTIFSEVTLPINEVGEPVTNIVTGGQATCTPEGVVTIILNQSEAANASVSVDLAKFFDDTVVTVLQQGSSIVCDAQNVLRLTLALSNGQAVTLETDLSKLASVGGTTDCVEFSAELFDANTCVSTWNFTQDNCPGGSVSYDLSSKFSAPTVQIAGSKQRVTELRIGNKTIAQIPEVKIAPQVVRVFEDAIDVTCLAECQYAMRLDTLQFFCWRDATLQPVNAPPVAMFLGAMEPRAFACAWIAAGNAYCNNYQKIYVHDENVCKMCVVADGLVEFTYTLPSGSAYEIDVGDVDATGTPVGYRAVDSGAVFSHNFNAYKGCIKVRLPLCEDNKSIVWSYSGDITPQLHCNCC